MGLLSEALISLTTSIAKRIKNVSREKLAAIHEAIAKGIREGKFVPEKAISEYDDDAENLDTAYGNLPD